MGECLSGFLMWNMVAFVCFEGGGVIVGPPTPSGRTAKKFLYSVLQCSKMVFPAEVTLFVLIDLPPPPQLRGTAKQHVQSGPKMRLVILVLY